MIGPGVGLVVSIHAFFSDDLSSNLAGYVDIVYKKILK